jgi:hypothetical protein
MSTSRGERFNPSDIILSVAEAALHNQKAIGRSRAVLDKAIAELHDRVPSRIAEEVREAVLIEFKKVASDTADCIASEVTKRLKNANLAAERAADTYLNAASAAEAKMKLVVFVSASVAIACSVVVSLIIVMCLR